MSPHQRSIWVEGEADRALLQAIGIPRRRIRRGSGKGNICNQLERSKEVRLEEGEKDFGIQVLRDPERNHLILLLCPNFEGWILRVAERNRVDVQNFGLPNSPDELHKAWPGDLHKLERLVQELSAKGSPELKFLKSLLQTGNVK